MKIINTNYIINNKLNKKIVHISDIHYKNKKDINRLNYIIDNIKKLKPDYICITGDITDKSNINDELYLIEWLTKLSNITKVIVSIGNHEFYNKKENKLNNNLLNKINKINNLYLLDNKNIVIDNINFVGCSIPIELYDNELNNKNKVLNHIDSLKTYDKKYNILLIHSPISIFDIRINRFDLVLSGHMHGGVVLNIFRPIFKNNGLINPNKKLFPKNVYGNIKINNTNIIITSGLKVIPFKLINKIFKPEIVLIKV